MRTSGSLPYGGLCLGCLPNKDPLDRDPQTETPPTETPQRTPSTETPRQRPPRQKPPDKDPLDRDPQTETPQTENPPVMWPVVHAGIETPLWTESQTRLKHYHVATSLRAIDLDKWVNEWTNGWNIKEWQISWVVHTWAIQYCVWVVHNYHTANTLVWLTSEADFNTSLQNDFDRIVHEESETFVSHSCQIDFSNNPSRSHPKVGKHSTLTNGERRHLVCGTSFWHTVTALRRLFEHTERGW